MRLRASLLAKAEDKAALTALYEELQARLQRSRARSGACCWARPPNSSNATTRRWSGIAACPAASSAGRRELRAANVLHELKRARRGLRELRALQSDAAADEEARRDAYLLEAELRVEDKDDAGELDAYARGLAAYPDDGALLYARALSWERRDDIARAEADLRKVLVAEPDNVAALNALGYTLADRTTRYKEALELIDRARVADPGQRRDHRQLRLGAVSPRPQRARRWSSCVAPSPCRRIRRSPRTWAKCSGSPARRKRRANISTKARKLDPENRSLQRALAKTGA